MKDEKLLFGTKEWAPNNFNFMSGCSNNCVYCYAKDMAIRFKRKTYETWEKEETVNMVHKSYGKKEGAIMLPSSHDITPGNIDIAVEVIEKLLASWNELLIVTKPHLKCIERVIETVGNRKSQIRFRFTIGSADNDTLTLWEPGAPSFEERLESMKLAFDKGFSCSVSCEPLLDNNFDLLYEKTINYVTDSIWIGKMNMASKRVRTNTNGMFPMEKVEELIRWQSDEEIIKLFLKYKDNPKIQWKESIKKVAIAYGLM